ncbi:hypothetical protein FHX10_002145 [Rhizobium sp. BK591]|uniref:hypothetical protein n=1 Tax=Rhizobium TaxID=379 RepID=UPI001179C690|nr:MULTISPECIES: hypothetical protein [Rhizobium]MBB3742652.1 hypothetical protein [Rhizobium sp. BK591]
MTKHFPIVQRLGPGNRHRNTLKMMKEADKITKGLEKTGGLAEDCASDAPNNRDDVLAFSIKRKHALEII